MKLTKDKYLKSLDYICDNCNDGYCSKECMAYRNIEQLIEEYFILKNNFEAITDLNERLLHTIEKTKENLPLKFEEIREGYWIWDSYELRYFVVQEVFVDLNGVGRIVPHDIDDRIKYEKNRFYQNIV